MAQPSGGAVLVLEEEDKVDVAGHEVSLVVVIDFRELLINGLKELLLDLTEQDIRLLWGQALKAWMRTITFGHVIEEL